MRRGERRALLRAGEMMRAVSANTYLKVSIYDRREYHYCCTAEIGHFFMFSPTADLGRSGTKGEGGEAWRGGGGATANSKEDHLLHYYHRVVLSVCGVHLIQV